MRTTSRDGGGVAALALASAFGLGACQDPLLDPAVVVAPRIVGARVRAEQDRGSAEPRAGERASIDWLVLAEREGSFKARVVWCRAAPSSLGSPRCEGTPTEESSASGSYGSELSWSFQVPDALAPGDAWLSWLGVCEAGEPVFDAPASVFDCANGEALAAFYRGFVPEQAANRNPSLADDVLLLDGAPWNAAELEAAPPRAPRQPCRGSALPSLSAGAQALVSFELAGEDREPLQPAPGQYAAHPRESLVYTHVASHPGLDRAFSAIDYDAAAPAFELLFDGSEAQPGPDGETLLFQLLVRDERGGADWLRRAACLLPPSVPD